MQELSLSVKRWVAWLPGLDQCAEPDQWSMALAKQNIDQKPDVSFVPAITRRRLSPATKIALKVAQDCVQGEKISSAVFCSRHGECQRTLGIYQSMASGAQVSPMQFSQSVHNTAAGVFSIENKLNVNCCSIAAGPASGEHGFIEAAGLLKSGMGPVLWVMADSQLNEPYSVYCQVPELPFGIAMLLEEGSGGEVLSLNKSHKTISAQPITGTDNLLALLFGNEQLSLSGSNGWRWSK